MIRHGVLSENETESLINRLETRQIWSKGKTITLHPPLKGRVVVLRKEKSMKLINKDFQTVKTKNYSKFRTTHRKFENAATNQLPQNFTRKISKVMMKVAMMKYTDNPSRSSQSINKYRNAKICTINKSYMATIILHTKIIITVTEFTKK